MTLAERLDATGQRPTGFDYMRITLAALILGWHSIITSYGDAAQAAVGASPAQPFVALLLPMFFSLSGFLVSGSLERTRTIALFLGLRVIRIFPALCVESLVSALVLGPLLTRLPLRAYVSHPLFHRYFLNVLGDPQYVLPGVFDGTPCSKVNAQLWTVPWELQCYIAIAVLALAGVVRRRYLVAPAMVVIVAAGVAVTALRHPQVLTAPAGTLHGWLLVVSFLGGVGLYLYRERVAWSARWGFAALAAALLLLAVPFGRYLAVFPISYVTIWLGLTNFRKVAVLRGADYSYGVFLYSFALQQTFVSLGPWARHWWLNVGVCLPAALAVAALSWRFVETPALALRQPLKRLEGWWLARRAPPRPAAETSLAAE